MEGFIKRNWAQKGFTFVAVAGEDDVFLHFSQLVPPLEQEEVPQGAHVSFELFITDDGNRQAHRVQLLAPAPTSAPASSHDLRGEVTEGVIGSWKWHKGYGFIVSEEFPEGLYVHHTEIHSSSELPGSGTKVRFRVGVSNGRESAKEVEIIGFAPTGDLWEDFAVLPHGWTRDLAALAEPEDWNYRYTESSWSSPVLVNYLRYTFLRLHETRKLVEASYHGRRVMGFNTGLVTRHQQQIFAIFVEQKIQSGRFQLLKFLPEGRTMLEIFGSNEPPLARYFDEPVDLLFDDRLDLKIAIDHVEDRLARAPRELVDNSYAFLNAINSQAEPLKRRVARNYKTAIPVFYRPKGGAGRLQLLLPLCLVQPNRVDLALTVEKVNGVYYGATVLTVDMAYSNARLLTKPDTEWLRPERDKGAPVALSSDVVDEELD
ncbi:DUF3825 domain-containing protein [Streptomyces sp. DT203]|uniref:DUF3825 domain-containing protein n=1 Tax=Streptomyces sp. DT203 TaxID=3393424 RepID=UPI003CEA9ED5